MMHNRLNRNSPRRTPVAVQRSRKSARQRGFPGTLTLAEWERALKTFGNACAYCGKRTNPDALTIDHVIPLSNLQSPGSVAANVVPACPDCNLSKLSRPLAEWLIDTFGAESAAYRLARIQTYQKESAAMSDLPQTDGTPNAADDAARPDTYLDPQAHHLRVAWAVFGALVANGAISVDTNKDGWAIQVDAALSVIAETLDAAL